MKNISYSVFLVLSLSLLFLIGEFTLLAAYNLTHTERLNTWTVDNYPRNPGDYIKIAIFGESAAYGYNSERSFSDILEYELRKRFPGLKFYFKNYAFQGTTFHRNQAEICKMVIKKYDIFLIYAGNNEANLYWDDIGYFRTAKYKKHKTLSVYNFTSFRKKVISSLISYLETKSRIYAILKKARNRLIKQKPNNKPSIKSNEFYQYRQFKEFEPSRILPDEGYKKIIVNFEKDLEEIARLARKYKKHVIVSSVPVNEYVKPFFSAHKTGLSKKELVTFQENYERGLELYKFKNFQGAIPYFLTAAEIDDRFAILDYMLGYSYLMTGNIEKGRQFLTMASDNDGFPERALSSFSKIEELVSKKYESVHFIDSVNDFHNLLDKGYKYDELFSDIHHPSLLGHLVLFYNFLNKILEIEPFKSSAFRQNSLSSITTDYYSLLARYKRELSVTDAQESINAFGIARWFIGLSALAAYRDDYLDYGEKYLVKFYETSDKGDYDKVTFLLFSALVETERSTGDIKKAINLANEAARIWLISKEKGTPGACNNVEDIINRPLPLGDLIIERFNKAGIVYSYSEKEFFLAKIQYNDSLTKKF